MTALLPLVRTRKLIVCVGAGGVGKTTTAATIALRAAMEGRRALVLTIDPARRLANALGLQELGNREVQIDLDALARSGVAPGPSTGVRGPVGLVPGEALRRGAEPPSAPSPRGELWAMMLDPRATLDDVIRRVAPTEGLRQALEANRVYRHIAGSFSGSQEYMATERLYDVVTSGRYDLVVLDTPPVKNALDFLDSPGRLTRFLDKQIMKWFLAQETAGVGRRLLAGTSTIVHGLLGHIFGRDFLDELGAFFKLFGELYEGFRERHEHVGKLFAQPSTAFLVVAAPTETAIDVARYFLEELRQRGLPLAGLVLNQVHVATQDTPDVEGILGDEVRALDPDVAPRLLARMTAAHGRLRELVRSEERRIASIRAVGGATVPVVQVPRLRGEVHDLQALLALHLPLFGSAPTVLSSLSSPPPPAPTGVVTEIP